jgi:hypothetical protein
MRDDEVLLVGMTLRARDSDLDPGSWDLRAHGRTVPLKSQAGLDGTVLGEAEVHRDLMGNLVALATVPLRWAPRLVGHPYLAVLAELNPPADGDDAEPPPRLVSVHVTETVRDRLQPPYQVHTSRALADGRPAWLTRDYTSMTVIKSAQLTHVSKDLATSRLELGYVDPVGYVEWRHRSESEPR